ncbi:MAG: hypothetical protein CME36_13545 [unclassified Hahellaceae]|nr:hypothetical protein [Hahellaceae bacterium]
MADHVVHEKRYRQLTQFLCHFREDILDEWSRRERDRIGAIRSLKPENRLNSIPHLIDAIAREAANEASLSNLDDVMHTAARHHAEERRQHGFSLEELTREYAILREVILEFMDARRFNLATDELVYLNRALDEAIIKGVNNYVTDSNVELEAERERLQITLKCIADGVATTDCDGRIERFNKAAERITGWAAEVAIGRPVGEVLVAVDALTSERLACLSAQAANRKELVEHPMEINLLRKDGVQISAEEVAAPLRDAEGHFLGVVSTFRDVSQVRSLTSELSHLAAHDALTGLPNRNLLIDRITQALAKAERSEVQLALLYLDLDLFKDVNDMLGHSAGDELLQEVAARLLRCVRQADTVSRMGGDEFVVLLTEVSALTHLGELAREVVNELSGPYQVGSHLVNISASVGVSVYPQDGCDADTLIKHADVAMYQAKANGRNAVQFFTSEMNDRARERRNLQTDLRRALTAGQFVLKFQPQMDLKSERRLLGVEALLRWRHPKLGLISPARFIPIAEDSREIMVALGNWVLEQACRQAKLWRDEGHEPLRISVNVSLVQLRHQSLVDQIAALLSEYELAPEQLQLELTESILMSEVSGASERVRALGDMGVRIAVDDFGTGYSSLSYLKDLPVDELKIDRSFVQGVAFDQNKAAIAQAIIRMGQSLELRVLAEGVDDLDAVQFLKDNGCDGAQGYHYSKPITAQKFARKFLAQQH